MCCTLVSNVFVVCFGGKVLFCVWLRLSGCLVAAQGMAILVIVGGSACEEVAAFFVIEIEFWLDITACLVFLSTTRQNIFNYYRLV